MRVWVYGFKTGADVWAVSSNGGSSSTNVMNMIFLIHHKDTTHMNADKEHSITILPPNLLISSAVGEDVKRSNRNVSD